MPWWQWCRLCMGRTTQTRPQEGWPGYSSACSWACTLLMAKIHVEPRIWCHSLAGRATCLWAYGLPWTSSPTVVLIAKSRLTLCDPMDCSPPGSCVHGILQARMLERVAISSSRLIFSTQGLNESLLHWQVDSLPQSHLENPSFPIEGINTCPHWSRHIFWKWVCHPCQ